MRFFILSFKSLILILSFVLFFTNSLYSDSSVTTKEYSENTRKTKLIDQKIKWCKNNINSKDDSIKSIIEESLSLSIEEKYFDGIIWNYYLLGRFHQLRFENDSSLVNYKNAWTLIKKSKETNLIYAISLGIANIYWESGNYSEGLFFCMDAKQYFESKNLFNDQYALINLIALNYEGLWEYETALRYYKDAFNTANSKGDKGFVAVIHSNMGRLHFKQKDYDQALEYLISGAKSELENNFLSNAGKSYSLIAKVYLNLNQPDSAFKYINKAFQINTSLNDELGLTRTYLAFGQYYQYINKYHESINYLNKAIELAEKIKLNDELIESYQLQADNYYNTTNFKASTDHYKKYLETYQKVYDFKKISKFSALEHKLKIEQHENEIILLKIKEREQQNKLLLIVTILVLLITLILIVFVLYYHKNNNLLHRKNKEIREQKDIFEELNKKLILAEKNAGKADEIKSKFLKNLSHEIRTPLNGIVGFSSLIADSQIPDEKKPEIWNNIQKNSEDLINIIEGLLEMSMISSNQIHIKKNKFNVSEFIKTLEDEVIIMKQIFTEKQIETHFITDPSLKQLNIISDQTILRKALLNIVNNAFKFSSRGKVNLIFKLTNNHLLIEIADNGIGILEEKPGAIFEQFKKGLNIEESSGGLGIGLTLSKNFIELLDGEIWYESKIRQGSTFHISIPVNSNQ